MTEVDHDRKVALNQVYEKYRQDKQLAEQMLLIPSQPVKFNHKRITEEVQSQSSIAAPHEIAQRRTSKRIFDDPVLELTASHNVSMPDSSVTSKKKNPSHMDKPSTEDPESRLARSVRPANEGIRSPLSIQENEPLYSANQAVDASPNDLAKV